MSFRNWSRYVAVVGLQIVTIIVLAQLLLGVWSQYQVNGDRYRDYQKSADEERNKAAEKIASDCAIIANVNPAFRECLRQQIEAYQKKDDANKDLQAQQDMAYWALWTAVVGFGGLIVSMGGVWLLILSLRQTRQAISTDREVGHAQVRAYLTIEPGVPDAIRQGHTPVVEIKIKNTGQSPAYFVKYIATIGVEAHPIDDSNKWFIFPEPSQIEPIGMTMPSQGDFMAEAKAPNALTAEDVQKAMNGGDKRIYLACVVYYRDVFKVPRMTRFCSYLDDSGKTVPGPGGQKLKGFAWMVAPINNEAT